MKLSKIRIAQSLSVELKETIEKAIDSKVKNETYLLNESLIVLDLLRVQLCEEIEQRVKKQLAN